MFERKKNKDSKNIDIGSLNSILSTGKKLINIGYLMAIVALVLLATYIMKEWHVFGFIKELLMVISPIFIGFIIAWLFDPSVTYLEKRKIPRVIGCIIVYLLILGGLFLFLYMLIPTFLQQLKDFMEVIPGILKELMNAFEGVFNYFERVTSIDASSFKDHVYQSLETFGLNLTTNIPLYLLDLGKALFSGGLTFVLGLMIGFYMLFDFNKISNHIDSTMPKKWKKNYTELCNRINTSLRSYIEGLFIVMFLVFITQSIGLTLAGLEAPLIFALFCALTDVIPYFGPYIGAIPAIIVGFTISPITGLCCVISILVVQLLENNFYQPLIMGHAMKLHPVTIMVGLLIFQHFFGIIGMIVATPVIACLKVIVVFVNEKVNFFGKITKELDATKE